MNIIKDFPPQLPDNCFVAVDVEMYHMNSKQLHRPNSGRFACLTICPNENDVYILFEEKQVSKALEIIQNCVWTAHNSKFDITQLRRYANIPPRKKLWDTLIIERIMWGGYYDLFALEDLARRYLRIYMDKSLQSSFENMDFMSNQMVEYACKDSLVQRQIALKQKEIMDKNDWRIYSQVDLPAQWANLDYRGFPLDVEKWKALAKLNKHRQEEIDKELDFNPRSPIQVKEFLDKNGWKGLPSTGADVLEEWMRKKPDCEAARVSELVLKSRHYGKMASTYGMNFIEDFIEEVDGVSVIFADYDVNKAETGREASRNPNLQNIPARETSEFRECFIPYPSEKLLVADYSSQEPRISAFYSKDKRLIEIITQGKDIYTEQARDVFGIEIDKSDPRRSIMKDTFLGMTYGLSKYGLSKGHGISLDEADLLIKKTFNFFPQLARTMNTFAQNTRLVTTVWGRKCWLNPYSSQVANNARNSPIQGTAADMMKRAKAVIHEEWNWDCPFGMVNMVHDELVLSVPERLAPEIGQWVSDIMAQVGEEMCKGIPFKADYKICDNWSEK